MKNASRTVISYLKVELYKALLHSDLIHLSERPILKQLAIEPEIQEYIADKKKEDVES